MFNSQWLASWTARWPGLALDPQRIHHRRVGVANAWKPRVRQPVGCVITRRRMGLPPAWRDRRGSGRQRVREIRRPGENDRRQRAEVRTMLALEGIVCRRRLRRVRVCAGLNLDRHPRWLIETQTPFICLALAAFLFTRAPDGSPRPRAISARRNDSDAN